MEREAAGGQKGLSVCRVATPTPQRAACLTGAVEAVRVHRWPLPLRALLQWWSLHEGRAAQLPCGGVDNDSPVSSPVSCCAALPAPRHAICMLWLLQGPLWDWYRTVSAAGWQVDARGYTTSFRSVCRGEGGVGGGGHSLWERTVAP